MSDNNDVVEKIMTLTKIMSLKIAQLSPNPQIATQLEQLVYLNQDYGNFFNEYKNQVDQLAPLRQKLAKLEKEMQDNQKSFDSQGTSMIQKLQNEKSELEKNLETISEDFIQVNNKVAEQNEKINNLIIDVQKLNNKLQGEWKATQDLRKTLQTEREEKEDLKLRINELKRTLRRLQRRLARGGRLFGIHIPIEKIEETEVSSTDSNAKEQLEQMKFELQKRMDKITEFEMKNRELKNQIMKSPTKDLQLQVQNLQKELDAKAGRVSTFEGEKKKLEQQIGILQNRITDLQVSYQEQTKNINDREKRIKDLEHTMRLGIHEKSARDLIIDLQEKNKELQATVRAKDKDIRSLDKNSLFYKQQLDVLRGQVQTLYAKNRELLTRLQQGGSISPAELKKGMDLFESSTPFDQELKDQQHKLHRLQEMTKNMEQELSDLRYTLHNKDAKIEELSQIMNELKILMAKHKIEVGPTKKKKGSKD